MRDAAVVLLLEGVAVQGGVTGRGGGRVGVVVVGLLRELQALDGRRALLADVADDVGDGVGFVAEVAVGDVDHAQVREAL